MEATFSFENIIAWQKAHEFTLHVYDITRSFPADEKFGLTSQFRRAAVSIEANIAEGYKKLSKADKLRFLNIAQGSLEECRNYIILSRDLGFISSGQFNTLVQSIEISSKLLNGYCRGIVDNNGVKDESIDICPNSITP
jgi:four helix bundle protein